MNTSNPADSVVHDLDHLGLVAGMVDELKIVETIDTLIPQAHQKRHISIGLAVKAMILNGLGFVQRALYLTPMFFKNKPVERLLGQDVKAEHLNDDTLGRALDAIFEYGAEQLYAQVAATAVKILGLNCKVAHLDATSFHTDGQHNSKQKLQEGTIHITRGHSRDHRPDLNQVVLQLVSENQSAIPLRMAALSGNTSDKTSFRDTVNNHIEQMKVDVGLQYIVADSALYTASTIKELGEFNWITRVPETITLAQEIIRSISGELIQEAGEKEIAYRVLFTQYGDIKQRWLVVYSRSARQRAEKSLKNRYIKQSKVDARAFGALKQKEFACEADAQSALDGFTANLTHTIVSDGRVEACEKFAKKGRPGKNCSPDKIVYKVNGAIASQVGNYWRELERKSSFIIATNELNEEVLSNDEAIELYKKGQQKVERGFRFLKDPLFMAAQLFLKSTKRIVALMVIMTLSLLVYSAIEYRIRKVLKESDKTFPNQLGKPTVSPTARWVFQFFSGIRLLIHFTKSKCYQIILNLNDHHRALLTLLGERYVAIYDSS